MRQMDARAPGVGTGSVWTWALALALAAGCAAQAAPTVFRNRDQLADKLFNGGFNTEKIRQKCAQSLCMAGLAGENA